jgi:hypothetical protein
MQFYCSFPTSKMLVGLLESQRSREVLSFLLTALAFTRHQHEFAASAFKRAAAVCAKISGARLAGVSPAAEG